MKVFVEQILKKINRIKGNLRKKKVLKKLCSSRVMMKILERERCRADRYQHEFSLILINLQKTNEVMIQNLTNFLFQRLRSNDVAGLFDAEHICVLLPETAGDDAWRFAEDIQKIFKSHPFFECRVYTYPSTWTPMLTNKIEKKFLFMDTKKTGNLQ